MGPDSKIHVTAPLRGNEPGDRAGAERISASISCLLCDFPRCSSVAALSSAEILQLWAALGVRFSDAALGTLLQTRPVELRQCPRCAFRFFDSSLIGNAAFYRELQDQIPTYYPTRPEFFRALKLAKSERLQSILDVGCGTGTFLDLALEQGFRTSGIEVNEVAAEMARKRGHTIHSVDLGQLRRAGIEALDFITLFQVLEHVAAPRQILQEAKDLLRPGGFIAVGVPNDKGLYQVCPLDPHQWPPHHISRWRLADLLYLGRQCGLEIVGMGSDRLLGGELEYFWKLHNKLAPAVNRKGRPGKKLLPKMVSLFYRKTGLKYFFPRWGTNIYIFYRKPAPRRGQP